MQNNILSRYKIKSGLYIDLRPENMELGTQHCIIYRGAVGREGVLTKISQKFFFGFSPILTL